MKKLLALLNTPARAVIAVGLIILLGEFLIMMLIEDVITPFITHELWHFIDPILLVAIVSPAFYLLIFRPLRKQQIEIEDARKKIEQVHQEWMAALDVVNDPIFLHDKQFRVLRANRAYQKCAGIRFREIIGQPYYEIFPKTGAPLPSCLRVMEKTETAADEEEMMIGNAAYRSRTFSVYGEQGVYLHSVHILENITEKKQADAERQQLSEAIHQAAEAIIIVDTDARITFINPAFTHLFGYAPDEIIGQSTAILSVPAAETVQPDEAFRIVSEQGFFQGEALRLAKGGTILPVYINVAALHGAKGEFRGSVAAITDLRSIKAAQQRLIEGETKYRQLIENLQEGIWVIDKGANTSFVNLRMAQMLGYSVEEMQGRPLYSFMDERGKEIARQNLERRKQGIREQHDFELLRKDGSRIYTSMATSPILDEAENYAGALAGVTDITERKLAESKLAEHVEELRRWYDATLGREIRILDLKREVNELLGQTGQPPRYPSAESDGQQEK